MRELIISGQLTAGEFISPETVAHEIDISATPAREDLRALQSEASSPSSPTASFRVSPLSAQDIRDTFAAQALLAGGLTPRAALVVTTGPDCQGLAPAPHEVRPVTHGAEAAGQQGGGTRS